MKRLLMICSKTALLSAILLLCTVAAMAAVNSRVEIPEANRFSSSLPVELSTKLSAQRTALQAELESVQAEMAQAKMEGRNCEQLMVIADAIRSDLGMKNNRPFGDYAPSLDEGGESCTSATLIPGLPFSDVGYTCDNADDDNTDCANSGGPDVFYTFTPTVDMEVRLTTCLPLTNFDTVLKIRDSAGNIIACNDDIGNNNACLLPTGQYWRSTIDCVLLTANERYCIIVDGYGWTDPNDPNFGLHCGEYQLVIEECGCFLCPIGASREGEPVCQDGYIDTYNTGCNFAEVCLEEPVYSYIECGTTICGTSGNFISDNCVNPADTLFRDTDWYLFDLTAESRVTLCVAAEFNSLIAIIDVTNGCSPLSVVAVANGIECEEACIDSCLPAGQYAFFVSTEGFTGYPCGSKYSASITCGPCEEPCFPEPEFLVIEVAQGLPHCECLFICPDIETVVAVGPGLGLDQQPIISILPGCVTTAFPGCMYPDCQPAFPLDGYWDYNPLIGAWYYHFMAAPGTAAGCVCLCVERILPVELIGFDAVAGDRTVALNWRTASETDNDYFRIVRDGTVVGQVDANNSATGSSYNWTDNGLSNGRSYEYSLVAVSENGTAEEIATTSATPAGSAATISEYALHQNYPNPFNPETNIIFDIVDAGIVNLTVYNATGQTIATLVNGAMTSGRHAITFDAAGLPSGLYFYRLDAGDFSAVKKMVLMK